MALSWEDHIYPISKTRLKITFLELHSDLSGANELTQICICDPCLNQHWWSNNGMSQWLLFLSKPWDTLSYQIRSRMYQLCGEVLYRVSKAKYLGVLISNDLSWHEQVCKVAAKANTTLHFIAKNLKHCPRSMSQTAYCSLTHSGMEYNLLQCLGPTSAEGQGPAGEG